MEHHRLGNSGLVVSAVGLGRNQLGRRTVDVDGTRTLAAQPSVSSVIAGATRPEQVRGNAQAGA